MAAISARRRLERRLVTFALALLVAVGVMAAVPKLAREVGRGDPRLLVVAVGLDVISIAGYVLLFWGVYGTGGASSRGRRSERNLPQAQPARELAGRNQPGLSRRHAPRGWATGFAAEFWLLSRAGSPGLQITECTTAFLILSNAALAVELVVLGALRAAGVVAGGLPAWLTVLPAALALAVIVGVSSAGLLIDAGEPRQARWQRARW